MKKAILYIHPHDNVAVALNPIAKTTPVEISGAWIGLLENIPAGHKLAIRNIPAREKIFKYGHCIGHATQDIPAGAWVHSHNLHTDLANVLEYRYKPIGEVRLAQEGFRTSEKPPAQDGLRGFRGYRRANGKVGTRNE